MVEMKKEICIVGAGRIGLPIAVTIATSVPDAVIVNYDRDETKIEAITRCGVVSDEPGINEILDALKGGNYSATSHFVDILKTQILIISLSAGDGASALDDYSVVRQFIERSIAKIQHLESIIVTSTLFPGMASDLSDWLGEVAPEVDFTYVPERVAPGNCLKELREIPHLIAGKNQIVTEKTAVLYRFFSAKVRIVSFEEAEFVKLISNSWRYLQFVTANEYYALVSRSGCDFSKIYHLIYDENPRGRNFPPPALTGGPCLPKDHTALQEWSGEQFVLGAAAVQTMEAFVQIVISQIKEFAHNNSANTLGIMGLAYKPESGDMKGSLVPRILTELRGDGYDLVCTDPFVRGIDLSFEEVQNKSDCLIILTEHKKYRNISSHLPIWRLSEPRSTGKSR